MTVRHRVSQIRGVEEALRESEERFRLLAASVPVGIFRTDAEGKIEYVNQRVLQITGLTALEETADWRWGIDPHPDEREAVLAERTKAMAEGRVFSRNFRILTPQGVTRWVETRICPLFNEKGEQIGHAGMVEDVTERHQAEEALRESEERFRTLYESSRDGIAGADPDGRFTECNQAYADMLGYSREELQRIRYQDITPSKWHALNADAVREAMERGYSEEFEKEYIKKDGTVFPVSLRVWRIEGGAGRPVGVWTIARDITERKRADEALRVSDERFSKAFHASPLAIVIATVSEARIVDANESFLQLVGYSREEVIGRTSLELGMWADREQRERAVQEVLKRGRLPDWEGRVRTRSGEMRELLTALVAIELGGVPCLLWMSRDVTEHRQAGEALRENEKRLASIYDTVGDVIFLLDVEKDGGYRFTSVNHAFLSVTGLPAEAVVGKRVSDIIPEPSLTLVLGKYRQAVRKKAVVRWEETSDYPAGRLTGEVSVVAVFDEGGNCTHLVGTVHDITERKLADDALRESERRFRQVLDVSADMIYKLDLESDTFDYISPSVLEMTGFTWEEFIAMGPRGLRRRIHPEDWPDIRRGSEEFVELGSHPGFEYRLQCKDGEYRWLSDNRSLVRGEDGRALALVGIVRNVTERRAAQEELQGSVQLLRDTGEMAKVGGWELDLSTMEVSWTEEVGRIHGVEPGYKPKLEEALDFYAPESRPAVEAAVKKAAETGEPYDLESLFIPLGRKDKIWVRSLGKAVYSGGRIVKLAGTFQNIDKYKRAEEALQKNLTLYQGLIETTDTGFVILDQEGRVLDANREYVHLSGHEDPSQIRGRNVVEWTADYEKERNAEAVGKCLREGRARNLEIDYVSAQGKITPIEINATVVKVGGTTQILTLCRDISERRQAEERDRQLHAEHVRANELRRMVRILEQMAATLAHELRNPLGVISNSAYFLANQAGIEDPRAERHVEIIGREVASATRVINDILEFAHTPQFFPSPASLNMSVERALARSQVPANVRVVCRLARDLPPVVCDEERLERAFLDVITNAVQAMPNGGRLSVKTRRSADSVAAVFADTGEGIAPQNLAKVFDPMFTTKLRGIGLGLTVVRRTVEQHGGRVEMESTLECGTTVTVVLPLDSQSARSNDELPTEHRE